MRFSPPASFRTEKPVELDQDLARLTDATAGAVKDLELERAARWKPRRIRGVVGGSAFTCALDELLVINTEDAAVTVALPKLGPAAAGRCVAYARHDTANALVFDGSSGALINGAATFTAASNVGRGVDFVNDGSAWWTA